MMGDLSGPRFVNPALPGGRMFYNGETLIGFWDALMVSGFDIIGHNRTFQIHWIKRVIAYFIDLAPLFAPLWSLLYLQGARAPWVYGISGGIVLFAYSVALE